jgi:CelD/BcsL family acetyltransferase involved in cellulose biosynthesis
MTPASTRSGQPHGIEANSISGKKSEAQCVQTFIGSFRINIGVTRRRKIKHSHGAGSAMALQIEVGMNALDRLRSASYLSKWNVLANSCPWATAYQGPDFVLPWYQLYQSQYLPVIVYMEEDDGELAGLMTLALAANGKALVASGEKQAEYQCWLEKPDGSHRFIENALAQVRSRFGGARLHLKYMPPNTPVGWMKSDCKNNFFFRLREHSRPLMEINPVSNAQRLRRRNGKVNHLKKHGDIQFYRVIDNAEFQSIFDEICEQYERRLSERYHVTDTPFKNDPLKRPLFIELHKRGLLHATVLRVGGRLVASHIGLVHQQSLHTCISTHATDMERYSPGQVLFCMLGCSLAHEGVSEVDLTPGGDQHKEHFATTHDTVFELEAYSTAIGRVCGDIEFFLRHRVKRMLWSAGIEPAWMRAVLNPIFRS